jgi:hypothetical protein
MDRLFGLYDQLTKGGSVQQSTAPGDASPAHTHACSRSLEIQHAAAHSGCRSIVRRAQPPHSRGGRHEDAAAIAETETVAPVPEVRMPDCDLAHSPDEGEKMPRDGSNSSVAEDGACSEQAVATASYVWTDREVWESVGSNDGHTYAQGLHTRTPYGIHHVSLTSSCGFIFVRIANLKCL